MEKASKAKRKCYWQLSRLNPYQCSSYSQKVGKDVFSEKQCSKIPEKKDWEDAKCSVCLEFPHNAVLLLCSSYNKGCRPYICATSCRYSNCLGQYKKAYTKSSLLQSSHQLNGFMDNLRFGLDAGSHSEAMEVSEVLCPLCRGQVKGWTVVETAREYLNSKRRTCMQDKCSYRGTYKELRRHVKAKHPMACPRAIDPVREEKWKRLECEREGNDVISTIISSMPGSVVLGDYVLEPNQTGFYGGFDPELNDLLDEDDDLFSNETFNLGRSSSVYSYSSYNGDYDTIDEDDFGFHRALSAGPAATAAMGRGFRRMIFGRPRSQRLRRGNRDRVDPPGDSLSRSHKSGSSDKESTPKSHGEELVLHVGAISCYFATIVFSITPSFLSPKWFGCKKTEICAQMFSWLMAADAPIPSATSQSQPRPLSSASPSYSLFLLFKHLFYLV